MSQKLNSSIAVVGIDIGKNSFHVVGHDQRGAIVLRQKWWFRTLRPLTQPNSCRPCISSLIKASSGSPSANTLRSPMRGIAPACCARTPPPRRRAA